jgi:hypothetical protein
MFVPIVSASRPCLVRSNAFYDSQKQQCENCRKRQTTCRGAYGMACVPCRVRHISGCMHSKLPTSKRKPSPQTFVVGVPSWPDVLVASQSRSSFKGAFRPSRSFSSSPDLTPLLAPAASNAPIDSKPPPVPSSNSTPSASLHPAASLPSIPDGYMDGPVPTEEYEIAMALGFVMKYRNDLKPLADEYARAQTRVEHLKTAMSKLL